MFALILLNMVQETCGRGVLKRYLYYKNDFMVARVGTRIKTLTQPNINFFEGITYSSSSSASTRRIHLGEFQAPQKWRV
jgi:hypothetical protein